MSAQVTLCTLGRLLLPNWAEQVSKEIESCWCCFRMHRRLDPSALHLRSDYEAPSNQEVDVNKTYLGLGDEAGSRGVGEAADVGVDGGVEEE